MKEKWFQYKKTHDSSIKEELIIHYAPLVKLVAGKLYVAYGSQCELDDMISDGIFGLLDAIEKFDLTKDIKFETYASLRIRGAIIDGLRKTDWVSRTVRKHIKELNLAIRELSTKYGGMPSDTELAKYLNISEEEVKVRISMSDRSVKQSLDSLIEQNGDMFDVFSEIGLPEQEYAREELKNILAEALEHLNERHSKLITLYYYEGLTAKEIAVILGVSESRVSQMHSKALSKLKTELEKKGISREY